MKSSRVAILFALLFLATGAPYAFSSDYSSKSLIVNVYSDGVAAVVYDVDVDPTLVRVSLPLIGSTFTDLLVVNELGIPLLAAKAGSNVTVDSLGSSKLTFTYSTAELTSKVGILWTLNVTSPTNLVLTMPSGATIVSMSQIPLNVENVNERARITLPPGDNQVSYIISATAVRDQTQSVIQDAEQAITAVKAKGFITSEADSLLAQAKAAFNVNEYLNSEQLAAQAKTSALSIETIAQAAGSAIQSAATAIQVARSEGRTSTLAEAEASLADAQSSYSLGDYAEAKMSADLSYASATASKSETNYLLYAVGGLVALILAAAGIFLYNKRRADESKVVPIEKKEVAKKGDEGAVNLEAIFKKHPELRVDDKEVLRFLAEHRGEAFANEIRDRFDIPRTSAWRMIRRLITLGIVEERKIGGQSLIFVVKKYREASG